MKIEKRLAMARKATHMTQEDVSERIGTSAATISRYEQGLVNPPIEKLVALCDLYGVELQILDKDEVDLLNSYRELDDAHKPVARSLMAWIEKENIISKKNTP